MTTVRHPVATASDDAAGRRSAEDGAPRSSSAGRSPVRRRRENWRIRGELAILLGPALVVFVSFVILPVALAAFYGFYSWSGFGTPTEFVGIRNYVTILTDPAFHEALGHNAFIVVGSLVLQGPLALGLALLLNRKMRFQSLIRVLIFVPYVISEVVVGLGWGLMLQSGGALNGALDKIGLGALRADWISDPALAIWTLLIIITWKYIGFAVILFLAGLQGIPEELSEAAAIDGASYWQIQRHIVLPLMGPTIRIWAFPVDHRVVAAVRPRVDHLGQYVASTAGTSTMATYMVANGRNAGSFGYGSAVAVVMFLISLAVALIYQRFVLRRDTAGALTEAPNDRHRHPRRPARSEDAASTRRKQPLLVRRGRLHRARAHRAHARAGDLHHPRRLPLELRDHRRPGRLPHALELENYTEVLASGTFWARSPTPPSRRSPRPCSSSRSDSWPPTRSRATASADAARSTRCSPQD